LINAGLNFAGNDHIALNVDAAASGTHLTNSLKDLTKLGVNAVAVSGVNHVNVDLGADAFGEHGANFGVEALFSDNLDVTLNLSASGAAADLDVAGVAHMAQELSAMGIDHIDLGGFNVEASASIDQTEASSLINAGLDFAGNDTITLNVDTVHSAEGTHLSNSLKDLTKLGVNAVAVAGSDHVNVDLGTSDIYLGDSHIPTFDSALDVTLNVHQAQFNEISDISNSLAEAGIDHLGVFSSDLANDQGSLSALFGTLDAGLDITLKVDQNQNWTQLDSFVHNGVDLLSGNMLSANATWGDLIQVLHDSGLGHVAIEQNTHVTISDDLTAALYESGMLSALPEANIEIEASTRVLNTTLKAMAELGVDSVVTAADHPLDKLYVQLGVSPEDLHNVADLGDLFSAFGLDKPDHSHLFAQDQQAGLVLDQTSFNSLGASGVEALVGQLSKLGFTELDVLGADKVAHVYNITPQAPVHVEVTTLGIAQDDLAALFDPHHLTNKVSK